DTVYSWRTGFRIADSRRLTTVKLWSFGSVRHTVQLTYEPMPPSSTPAFMLSRLHSVQVIGNDGTRSPMTTLTYAAAQVGQVQPLSGLEGWSLSTRSISFFDVDKDGAMDLLKVEAGNQSYKRNLGGGSFAPAVALGNPQALGMPSVRMLDLDGDSGA